MCDFLLLFVWQQLKFWGVSAITTTTTTAAAAPTTTTTTNNGNQMWQSCRHQIDTDGSGDGDGAVDGACAKPQTLNQKRANLHSGSTPLT